MPSSARLVCVDPARVAEAWSLARDLIRRAIERTGLSDFTEIETAILSGKYLLWLALNGEGIEAAAATQLTNASGRKICVLVAYAGSNRKRWMPLLDGIETYAKAEGCKSVRIYGRKGWQRLLADYRARHVILDKELN